VQVGVALVVALGMQVGVALVVPVAVGVGVGPALGILLGMPVGVEVAASGRRGAGAAFDRANKASPM
jgi:hypothetical protein